MMFVPTPEQKAIIDADLVAQRVIACAGSGKTATAVRRLLEIRRRMGRARGYVALLSYSNVAVDTFRKQYINLASELPGLSDRVLIATVDSFITSQILFPHASKVMGCDRQPFLVRGSEPFLKSFKFFNGQHNVDIEHLNISVNEAMEFVFTESSFHGARKVVPKEEAIKAIRRLAETGAYTYELGRLWSLMTLGQGRLKNILACRYPNILIDEAQDVGPIHGILLSKLQNAGSTLSLIGDPNQSIYEFADADGSFLQDFNLPANGLNQPLTENRRSVTTIVELANQLSSTASKAIRESPTRKHGAYFMKYKPDDISQLMTIFAAILAAHGFERSESVVLCRGNALAERLSGGAVEIGQGATEKFACAAIWRDRFGDIANAFEFALDGVLKVLEKPPKTLRHDILTSSNEVVPKIIRRLVWQFLRNIDSGLPSAHMKAKTAWLPLLKCRLPALLSSIHDKCGLACSSTWTYNVTSKKVSDVPLWGQNLFAEDISDIQVKTVHRAKGESIGAVMYVAQAKDVNSLLAGPVSEDGRIGYVAVTRAQDLLILALPEKTADPMMQTLSKKGFVLWT